MKASPRWPVHPAPRDDEALSSWLNRVAQGYGMDLQDLLHYEFGILAADRLDIDPSTRLLEALSARSGLSSDRLRIMSVAGWVPWLLDSVEPADNGFESYVRQFSVLVAPGRRRPASKVGPWRAWMPEQATPRACPQCMRGRTADPFLKLTWRLPLMLTCPEHRCRLQPCYGGHGRFFGWVERRSRRRPTSALLKLDQCTTRALEDGHVQLAGRKIHAALWFRLLRTIIDELTLPLSAHTSSQVRTIRAIWERSGYPVRAGMSVWRPFEQFTWPIQAMVLEAAATAIHMIETGQVSAAGEQGPWFTAPPTIDVGDGKRPEPPYPPVTTWQAVMRTTEDLIAQAKIEPEAAEALFSFMLLGRRDDRNLHETEVLFRELEIPMVFMSHLSTQ